MAFRPRTWSPPRSGPPRSRACERPRSGCASMDSGPRSSYRIPGTTCGSSGWPPTSGSSRSRRRRGGRRPGPREPGWAATYERRSRTSTTASWGGERSGDGDGARHLRVEPAQEAVGPRVQVEHDDLGPEPSELHVDLRVRDREGVRCVRVAVPDLDLGAGGDLEFARVEREVVRLDGSRARALVVPAGWAGRPGRDGGLLSLRRGCLPPI